MWPKHYFYQILIRIMKSRHFHYPNGVCLNMGGYPKYNGGTHDHRWKFVFFPLRHWALPMSFISFQRKTGVLPIILGVSPGPTSSRGMQTTSHKLTFADQLGNKESLTEVASWGTMTFCMGMDFLKFWDNLRWLWVNPLTPGWMIWTSSYSLQGLWCDFIRVPNTHRMPRLVFPTSPIPIWCCMSMLLILVDLWNRGLSNATLALLSRKNTLESRHGLEHPEVVKLWPSFPGQDIQSAFVGHGLLDSSHVS